jgi:hypothetical protein
MPETRVTKPKLSIDPPTIASRRSSLRPLFPMADLGDIGGKLCAKQISRPYSPESLRSRLTHPLQELNRKVNDKWVCGLGRMDKKP